MKNTFSIIHCVSMYIKQIRSNRLSYKTRLMSV
ncbi:hypothetical protein Marme_1881 [Marinomonas mediterranea MMB-1]|jgi:hypothetical protein|uniref:Uncharacterized protein n=1 Tax=Marinomonas mediterranea (strain ATCC 700492 / JCM 21426 / NBRC 103028 / MMB-1) TaxID=717774 RepID=F2K257_MARM1|nr:hypothetical protein Marme_1881 [Marinomonas mediterranea MMB-1]